MNISKYANEAAYVGFSTLALGTAGYFGAKGIRWGAPHAWSGIKWTCSTAWSPSKKVAAALPTFDKAGNISLKYFQEFKELLPSLPYKETLTPYLPKRPLFTYAPSLKTPFYAALASTLSTLVAFPAARIIDDRYRARYLFDEAPAALLAASIVFIGTLILAPPISNHYSSAGMTKWQAARWGALNTCIYVIGMDFLSDIVNDL